jgi:hypothetical protein
MFRDASPTIGKCLMITVRISDLSGEHGSMFTIRRLEEFRQCCSVCIVLTTVCTTYSNSLSELGPVAGLYKY